MTQLRDPLAVSDPPALADLYAPIRQDLRLAGEVFDAALLSIHPSVNELCGRVQRYRGKMIRPALLLLSGQASGAVTHAHHTLAAVVEMVHLATLVHDDVLDEADLRRGLRTVNAARGNEVAVLLGDYLISHAYHLCSTLDDLYAARLIGQTTNTVCEGELLQVQRRNDLHLSEAEYLDIIRNKTASLTGTCCALGGRYAGAEDDVVDALRAYGEAGGVAFQIVDDILDLVGDERQAGKSLGRDAALGKPTLPVIHCLEHAGSDDRRRLLAVLKNGDGGWHAGLAQHLQSTGSVEYAFQVARGYVDEAVGRLGVLADSPAKDALGGMADFILRRPF